MLTRVETRGDAQAGGAGVWSRFSPRPMLTRARETSRQSGAGANAHSVIKVSASLAPLRLGVASTAGACGSYL